jgi:hypothetical protein
MFEEIGRKIKEVGNLFTLYDEIEDHSNQITLIIDTLAPTFIIRENDI